MTPPGPAASGGLHRTAHTFVVSKTFRLILDGPAPGAWNMAIDEALLASGRRGRFTVRFYGWAPGCLSLGRNEPARGRYDVGRAERLGIDIVRRPTGGRAVYHDRELTYSVTAPSDAWGGLRESYRRINRALAAGLRELGVPAAVAPGRASSGLRQPSPRACFRHPMPGEVVAGGRKLVGSAQWREGGALLQHGSILLHDDQQLAERLRLNGKGREGAVAAASLADVLGVLPPLAALCGALARGFASEFGVEVEPGEATAAERERARRLEARYRSGAWTWRR
ncbi:MAG: biotin/lipoate A/B protein ligase family protein [Gemmatimonadota bacterium]